MHRNIGIPEPRQAHLGPVERAKRGGCGDLTPPGAAAGLDVDLRKTEFVTRDLARNAGELSGVQVLGPVPRYRGRSNLH